MGDDRGRALAMRVGTARWLQKFVGVEAHETKCLGWSFLWFLFVLAAFYVLRPMRETVGVQIGNVERLILATFLVMLASAPVYSWFVDQLRRAQLVSCVYRFFSVWLLVFSAFEASTLRSHPLLLAVFYVWVSIFNLYVVAIFWSVLTDTYSSDRASRLFGFVTAGGSLGGLMASLFVSTMGPSLARWLVLLVPVLLLEIALFCSRRFERSVAHQAGISARGAPAAHSSQTIEPGIWHGFLGVVRSPYLLGIVAFLLLGKWCATTVYLEQVAAVREQVPDVMHQQRLFANENLMVQTVTLVFQLGVTRMLLRWLHVSWTLAILPLALIVGFLFWSRNPLLLTLFVAQIVQRVLTYGVIVPAREILFTVVSREDKFKAKGFIDTAIFRGGDTIASLLHVTIKSACLHCSSAWWMIPVCTMWGFLGWRLGIEQRRQALVEPRLPAGATEEGGTANVRP